MGSPRLRVRGLGAALVLLTMVACGSGSSSHPATSGAPTAGPAVPTTNSFAVEQALDIPAVQVQFTDISCPTATECWAVANATGTGQNVAQILHFVGGHWKSVVAPSAATLYGIDCRSISDCWAVGSAPGGKLAFTEHFDGRAWTSVAAPSSPGQAASGLKSVSCPAPNDCWAAGGGDDISKDPSTGAMLLLHNTGNGWQSVPAPSPQNTPQSGHGATVLCAAATNCLLVTTYQSTNGEANETHVDTYDGHTWASSAIPAGVFFTSVSCVGVNNCYAVDTATFTGGTVYHFDGTTWSAGTRLPAASARRDALYWTAFGCSAQGTCVIGGGGPIVQGTTTRAVLAVLDHGTIKSILANEVGEITAVACPGTARCIGVGAQAIATKDINYKALAITFVLSGAS